MEWIRVIDRLPEFAQEVFITDGKLVDSGRFDTYVGGQVTFMHFTIPIEVNDITHWRPVILPAPPA